MKTPRKSKTVLEAKLPSEPYLRRGLKYFAILARVPSGTRVQSDRVKSLQVGDLKAKIIELVGLLPEQLVLYLPLSGRVLKDDDVEVHDMGVYKEPHLVCLSLKVKVTTVGHSRSSPVTNKIVHFVAAS